MKYRHIGFTGAHGQGKSTLIRDLLDLYQKTERNISEFNLYSSPSRKIAESAGAHLVNETGSGATQIQIMHTHYMNIVTANNMLVNLYDRSAVDGLVYSLCLSNTISVEQLDIIKKYYHITIPMYDVIFYIEPEIELIQDGVRSINIDFFNNIKNMFDTVIQKYQLPRLVRVNGSREKRLNTVYNYISGS